MKIIAFLIISGFLYVTPSVAQNISTKLPEATGCPTPHLGPIDPRCQEVPKVYDVADVFSMYTVSVPNAGAFASVLVKTKPNELMEFVKALNSEEGIK